jgi:hypothetical protein
VGAGRLGAAAAIVVPLVGLSRRRMQIEKAFRIFSSMAERFALFTIIVLGEVIVGVVNGLSQAQHSTATTTVGLLCLGIGFGIWWNYFDFVGMRSPRPGLGIRGIWLVAHLPLSMAVAATGAGMVSLIEHSNPDHTPPAPSGSSAGRSRCSAGAWRCCCCCCHRARRRRAAATAMGAHARPRARAHRRVDRVPRAARPLGSAVRRLDTP